MGGVDYDKLPRLTDKQLEDIRQSFIGSAPHVLRPRSERPSKLADSVYGVRSEAK